MCGSRYWYVMALVLIPPVYRRTDGGNKAAGRSGPPGALPIGRAVDIIGGMPVHGGRDTSAGRFLFTPRHVMTPTVSGERSSAESLSADQEKETQFLFPPPEVVSPGSIGRTAGPLPTVPGYTLLSELGRGGFGVVYRAEQTGLKRLVALKVIRAGAVADDAEVERFRAEAQAVARLQHPHVVQVYEVGECSAGDGGSLPYFALEYVEGGTLADRLTGTPQPPREAALLIETLARAVHHAHEQGILHRDLKPTNILLTADGLPKVTDFGLAKRMDAEAGHSGSGAIIGTPC